MQEPAMAMIVPDIHRGGTAFFLLAIIKRGLSDGQKCLMSRPDAISHCLIQQDQERPQNHTLEGNGVQRNKI